MNIAHRVSVAFVFLLLVSMGLYLVVYLHDESKVTKGSGVIKTASTKGSGVNTDTSTTGGVVTKVTSETSLQDPDLDDYYPHCRAGNRGDVVYFHKDVTC